MARWTEGSGCVVLEFPPWVHLSLVAYHILIYFIYVILLLEKLQRSPCVANSELVQSTRRWFTANTLVPCLRRKKLGPRMKVTWGYWVQCCTPKSETRSRWRSKTWRPGSFLCILTGCFTGTHGHWKISTTQVPCLAWKNVCISYCQERLFTA